jgi:hypothetical protein
MSHEFLCFQGTKLLSHQGAKRNAEAMQVDVGDSTEKLSPALGIRLGIAVCKSFPLGHLDTGLEVGFT